MKPITIISIGGNAIIRKDEKGSIDKQFEHVIFAMDQVAKLMGGIDCLVITHGNGPIIGNIVIRNESAKDVVPPMPLYICDADSEGGIGLMLQQSLYNSFKKYGIKREVVTIITQVVVDKNDPAFLNPTKPIGLFYTEKESILLKNERGWVLKEDSNRGFRRVVPSPTPIKVVESDTIKKLALDGTVVIAAGGGGVPVVEDSNGQLKGIDAVIDKDITTTVLSKDIGAEKIINITQVDKVYINFGKPDQTALDHITISDAVRYMDAGEFAPGSMGPKIEAAIEFMRCGGKEVLITSLESFESAVQGRGGTVIRG